jgi:hypothetical protein
MNSQTSKFLSPIIGQIPHALKALGRWFVWEAVPKDDRVDKVPHNHRTRHSCNAHDPVIWSSFKDIIVAHAGGGWSGIGVLPGEGVLGVDLDKCRDPETGAVESWAQEIVDRIGSYTETSPSGTGVRVFVRGTAPGSRKKRGRIEMYNGEGGNFLTVTGHAIPGSATDVVENQAGVDWLYRTHLAGDEKSVEATSVIAGESRLTDEEVLDAIRASAQGEKFAALYDDGDWENYDYPSQSEADMALMSMLTWWTGSDPEQMERIFSDSQLAHREKWQDREDYRKSTIAGAVKANGGKHFCGQGPSMTPEDAFAEVETTAQPAQGQAWPDYVPFAEDPPEMPRGVLPGLLGEFVEALSEAIQTPRELAAINSLGVVALAVQSCGVVRVKPDYHEPLNIYGLVASEPGERKSAVVSACKAPLVEWEQKQAQNLREEIRRANSFKRTADKAIEAARQRAARSKSSQELEAAQAEIFAMETESPVVPVPPRLLCDDITPEALAEALAQHGESLGILEAEGGLFEKLNGLYTKGVPNIDIVLKSFGGEPVSVDRKSKEPILLQRPKLTLVLTPQPIVLADALGNRAFMGRGLVARFMLVLPRSRVGFRINSGTLDKALAARWDLFISSLLDTSVGIEPREIPLSGKAFRLWLSFTDSVEKAQRTGGEFEHIRPWASKLSGLTVRIAGLFSVVERGEVSPAQISEATMARAVQFAEWLAQHAKHVFGAFSTEGVLGVAKAVLEWLQREQREEATGREIFKALRGRYPTMKELRPGLDELLDRGALVRDYRGASSVGRKKEVYLVNPEVHQNKVAEPDLVNPEVHQTQTAEPDLDYSDL